MAHWFRILAVAALTAVLATCGDGSGSKDGGAACAVADGGAKDCRRLCVDYCSKLSTCGVSATSTCVQDCQDITEAGGSESTYSCVVETPCSSISNCGI